MDIGHHVAIKKIHRHICATNASAAELQRSLRVGKMGFHSNDLSLPNFIFLVCE